MMMMAKVSARPRLDPKLDGDSEPRGDGHGGSRFTVTAAAVVGKTDGSWQSCSE